MPKEDGKSADGAAAAPAASAVTADKDNDGLDDRFTQKHKDQMRVLCMSQDQFNKVLASGLAMYEIFKSVMATLLSIFVPQYCKPDLTHPSTSRHVGHDCTIEENFEELTQFNLFVVVWNFISLFFCMATYFFVYRRETIFNDLLDEDPTVTNDNLVRKSGEGNPCVLDLYPTISYTIRKRNTMVYFTAAFTMLILIVNIVTSGILVFYYYYTGFRTVTVFITNVTLILNILMTQARLAKRGTSLPLSRYREPALLSVVQLTLSPHVHPTLPTFTLPSLQVLSPVSSTRCTSRIPPSSTKSTATSLESPPTSSPRPAATSPPAASTTSTSDKPASVDLV